MMQRLGEKLSKDAVMKEKQTLQKILVNLRGKLNLQPDGKHSISDLKHMEKISWIQSMLMIGYLMMF